MFWNNHTSSPQMDILLKEDLTLNELLDQENILQELKSQNPKLIEFVTRHDVMSQLVSLVVQEPSSEMGEHERYRRSNIACEVLTTDIPKLNETLSESSLLGLLYTFLESDPPLNPLLASFFSRTMSVLICRNRDQNWYSYQYTCLHVLEFFKSKDNSLSLLLKHLGTSAIMDLTLKLITQIEGTDVKQIILNWFENEGLVNNVISLFDPSVDSDRQYNAAQLLCDTIYKCRENLASGEIEPIFNAIQSPLVIDKLLTYMLGGEILSESSIVGGISVLLTLLDSPNNDFNGRRNYSSTEDMGDPPGYSHHKLVTTVSAILPYLPKLHDLLINPPKKNGVKLAFGVVDPPLGNTRLSVVKLISALLTTNIPEVNSMLIQLNTFQVLLDLFFQYRWNNFLHTQVYKCLTFALNSPAVDFLRNPLVPHILIQCRLLQRILEAWEENETDQRQGDKRRGYMGHLTCIANVLDKTADIDLSKLEIDPELIATWHHFVNNSLTPINHIQERCLGGTHPAQNKEKNEDADFSDVKFPDDSTGDQNFTDDQKHVNNLEFACLDDIALVNSYNKLFETLNVDIPLGLLSGDNTGDEEVWSDMPNSVWNNSDEVASNSSDEEEKANVEIGAEAYADSDLWNSVGVGTPVVDPGNPWLKAEKSLEDDEVASGEGDEGGWADFATNFSTDTGVQDVTEPYTDNVVSGGSCLVQETLQPVSGGGDASIEDQLEAVQLSIAVAATTPILPSLIENINAPTGSEVHLEFPETSEKSDNNANISTISAEEILPDQELIDNFRFLSKQGMMVQNVEISSQGTSEEVIEEIKPESSSVVGVSSELDQGGKGAQDLV